MQISYRVRWARPQIRCPNNSPGFKTSTWSSRMMGRTGGGYTTCAPRSSLSSSMKLRRRPSPLHMRRPSDPRPLTRDLCSTVEQRSVWCAPCNRAQDPTPMRCWPSFIGRWLRWSHLFAIRSTHWCRTPLAQLLRRLRRSSTPPSASTSRLTPHRRLSTCRAGPQQRWKSPAST